MAEYPNTGVSLDHLFVDSDEETGSLGDNDFIDPNSASYKEDASIYNKQKADFGKQIDRDAIQVNGGEDLDPDHNPGQPGDYEYKELQRGATKGYVVRNSARLEGSKVFIEQRTASGRQTYEGTVLAESDEYPTFAVIWADRRVTVESKSHYTLRNGK